MIMKKSILFILSLVLSIWSIAQQQTQSSFNYINPYFINKSFAGLDTCTQIFFQHKNQYVGVTNSPLNTSLQAHTSLPKNFGIGLSINNWSAGLLNEFDASVAVAHHFKIQPDLIISPSVNFGFSRYTLSAEDAIVFDNDNYLNENQVSSNRFYGDLGLLATYQNIQAGLSFQRAFASDPEFEVNDVSPSLAVESYLKAHTSYTYHYNSSLIFTPTLVYRTIPGNGDMLDLIASANYENKIGVAIGYRTNSGLLASATYNLKDQFTIGYGFDVNSEQVAFIGQGSHELLVGYKFCKAPKEIVLPEVKQYFLSGNVMDQNQQMLLDANLTLKAIGTGVTSTLPLDSNGNYKAEVMPGLNYELMAEHPHYSTVKTRLSIDSLVTEKVEHLIMVHKTNSVHGTIVNAKDNTPMGGVSISLPNGSFIVSNQNGQFEFVANEQTLAEALNATLTFSKKGFNDTTNAYSIQPGNYSTTSLAIALEPIVKKDAPKIVDNKIIVNPIYFEVGSSKISDQAAVELNKIVEVMNENPELVIEVNSHTDCTGSASGNQKLSDFRAKSCVNFIKEKISNPNRVSGVGFGETKPITTCACGDCSKEDHAKNRRTEFIIIE